MNIDILTEWIKLDYIRYMMMAMIVLGIFKIFKKIVMRG